MTIGRHESGLRFGPLYARLVGSLGVVWVGGWAALLLAGHDDGIAALLLLMAAAMLAGAIAGPRVAAVVLAEAGLLVGLALSAPLLIFVWADTGPLSLVAVALTQLPVALVATRLARD